MKREEQRIFTGGLNLLTPSDKTPESDCIDLLNWRVDQAGVLRGADTFTQLTSVAGVLHTAYRLDDFTTTQADADGIVQISFGAAGAYLLGAGTNLYFYWPAALSGTGETVQIGTGFSGSPLSIVVWNGFIWIMDSAKQVKIDPFVLTTTLTGAMTSWLPAVPATALTATAGSLSVGPVGTYVYYVTYVNRAGLETNAGPASAPVTCAGASGGLGTPVALSSIPISPDADTWKRRIYRSGGTLGNAYQVTEITNNTATTFTDNLTDLDLTELGIQMPTTNDPPPTGGTFTGVVGPYFNTLLAWKDGKLFWSQNGIPLFPGSEDGNAEGNWVNVGSPDDKIQAITLHARAAVIYKQRSIWRLLGDAVTGTLETSSAKAGALGKLAVANGGQVDFALSKDGLFSFDIDALTPLSDRIAPAFLGQQWIQYGASDITQPIFNPTTLGFPICAYLNGQVLISDANGTAFLYHVGTGRISRFKNNYGGFITSAFSFGSEYLWYLGDSAGGFYQARQRAGGAQTLVYQTRFLDQGLGDEPKQYQEFVLDAELNGAAASIYFLTDASGAAGARSAVEWPFAQTFSGTTRRKFYFALSPDPTGAHTEDGSAGFKYISIRIELTCSADGIPPAIHGLYLYWCPLERDSAMRGTQVISFEQERISLCKRMEVDAAGQVDISILTDEPGGALTPRFLKPLPPISGRGVTEFNLPPNVRGRLWEINVIPQNATARVYGVRAWMRNVGDSQASPWEWRSLLAGQPAETPDAE